MKTHGKKYQRCFSMKQSIKTQWPNVKSKNLRSDILGQNFKLEISMKARKCIMKAGSLDKYLLPTKPAEIDTKFGLLLRNYILRKQKSPEWEVPYIPGTAKLGRSRMTSIWEYKSIPTVYMPAKAKINNDESKYYLKAPSEMSRHEIAELEQMLRDVEEPEQAIDDEEMLANPHY